METNVRETTTTTLEPVPNNQYLIPGIAIVLIVILALVVTLLANGNNAPTNNGVVVDTDNTQVIEEPVASFPVSNPI